MDSTYHCLNIDIETYSDVDIKTAKNAGMISIGCAWGFRGRAVLEAAGADHVLDKPDELIPLLQR